MAIETEVLELEGAEGEMSEAAEAAPRRPNLRNSFQPRTFGQQPPVSQGQLQAALGRVDDNVKKVADVEASISSRVSSLAAAAKKETAERKKSIESQIKGLRESLTMFALFPLLIQTPTASNPQVGGSPLKDGAGNTITSISTPDTSTLDALLPLLLVSGLGSSGTSGGWGLGGDGSSDGGGLMLLALVLAFARK